MQQSKCPVSHGKLAASPAGRKFSQRGSPKAVVATKSSAKKASVNASVTFKHPAGGAVEKLGRDQEALGQDEAQFTELDKLRLSTVNRYAQERKNSIVAVGLTVHTAPVEVREKLAVAEEAWNDCVTQLTDYPHISEACILSTCNRMELYAVGLSWHRGVKEIEDWLSKKSGLPIEELRPHLFLLRDRDAIRHLLRVSGGLDSLVMGEGQILAQVKNVHRLGTEYEAELKQGGFGRHLNTLFKQAIQAGKRVRSETDIASGAVSVSSAAAELAQLKLPSNSFDDCRVCIVGAGKMSKLLVKHLSSKGCNKMTVVNRSMPRCLELQEEFPDVEFTFELSPNLMQSVAESDVIFAASSSDSILITKEDVAAMPACPEATVGGTRRFFDISVPRNIDPAISNLDNARAFNVDDLKEVVDANKAQRAAAAAEAETLIVEELNGYEAWRDSLETVPTIKKLRSKAEDIRRTELEKAMNKVGEGLSKKERRVLEDLSKGIVNKLLHGPMQALRCDGSDPASVGESLSNMHALENMFDLKSEEEDLENMLKKAGRK